MKRNKAEYRTFVLRALPSHHPVEKIYITLFLWGWHQNLLCTLSYTYTYTMEFRVCFTCSQTVYTEDLMMCLPSPLRRYLPIKTLCTGTQFCLCKLMRLPSACMHLVISPARHKLFIIVVVYDSSCIMGDRFRGKIRVSVS